MTFNRKELEESKKINAQKQRKDQGLNKIALDFLIESDKYGYAYQWTMFGLPIIQMPEDIIATQEIIWETKPDIIIETG